MDTRKKTGRSDATRERLIAAAVELFGRRGFEGVGAREITAAAGVPLSAIPYHFTTKESLYWAVLARVSSQLGEALRPAAIQAAAAATGTPTAAAAALVDLQTALVQVFAADPQTESWARLLLREHLDPSPAFDIVYGDAGGLAVDLLAALVARTTGRSPDDQSVKIEAFARIGQALVFRVVQHAIKRKLDWVTFGAVEAEQVAAVITDMYR
jgi:TetR/AcrR family transcriptional regulator, regulator of cefoperazone and chloramphenicol sensitivity